LPGKKVNRLKSPRLSLQLDIELHAGLVISDKFKFGTVMREFFHKATAYLPIYAAPYSPDHPWNVKMTFINVKNPDCEEAFHFTRYFER